MAVNFKKAKFQGRYANWNSKTQISYLQRRIIVYSIQYYKLDSSCITDKEFDSICEQLVDLMWETDIEELEKTQYWYCMFDFDGNTGYDLWDRLHAGDKEYLENMAQRILDLWYSDNNVQKYKNMRKRRNS